MIGKISGRIDYIAEDHVLIEAAGVGYVVHASTRTLAALPGPGEFAALYTELVVREDLMQLYGFPTLVEKEWHRLLVSVQGVGPKHALAMMGLLGADGVGRAIGLGDAGALRRAPGVGPKLAERVVLELRAKSPAVMAMGARGAQAASPAGTAGAEAVPRRGAEARVAAPARAGQ
ncbi:MAG: Holliday junction branch migration protein RuvA, partial [Pseudomonadota bacterium]|nr:Holliday junction branch migration protein RuvA [Pseudomonadota bacterium]